MTQKEFYQSITWKRTRKAFVDWRISIDGGICQKCNRRLGKIVHHYKVWLNDDNCNDPNISLNFDNLMYECQVCHNQEINPDTDKRKIRWTDDGQLIFFGK